MNLLNAELILIFFHDGPLYEQQGCSPFTGLEFVWDTCAINISIFFLTGRLKASQPELEG